MIKERHIRCILFDLGSTLWATVDKAALLRLEETSNLGAVEILLRLTDHKNFSSMDAHTLGSLLRKAVEKQIRSGTRKKPGYEPDFVHETKEALQQIGVKNANRALGEAIYEALRIRIPHSRELFDDTLSTLTALKERGYILGVVTNRHYGGKPFYEDLQFMGLLDYFEYEHMAISADLGIRKPNPDIFLYALNRLNVRPEESAMVGDSLRADVVGAKMLNMLAIWKPKATLREEAKVAWMASIEAAGDKNMVGFTNDYLIEYAHNDSGQKFEQYHIDWKPDFIITHLEELLAIF